MNYSAQWRIQDFPVGGGASTPEAVTFRKFCMSKRKNLDPWGEACDCTVLSISHLLGEILDSREMQRFARIAKEWMDADEDNVIAIHCKGGKGRTGNYDMCVAH